MNRQLCVRLYISVATLILSLFAAAAFAQDNVGFFTTPEAGHVPFIQAINAARSTIRMEMFHLTDPLSAAALAQAAKRGVDVALILDGKSLQNPKFGTVAQQLVKAGVKIRPSSPFFSITHTKGMVIDNALAFITSVNLTTEAATTRDFGVVTREPSIIKEMLSVFAADWLNAANKTGNTPPLSEPHLVWSPVNSEPKLVALINSAQKSILSTVENLGDAAIENAFAKAAARGVDVRLIVPMCDKNPNPVYNYPFMKTLAAAGVKGRLMPHPATPATPYIHGKMMLVDGATAYVGSVNFSNNSTLHARELGIVFRNAPAAGQIVKVFASDWQHSADIPPTAPTTCPTNDDN